MSDSWPAPPPGDDASDSLAGQALEVERALKALEAVDAFRAEAAALRAELQAVRASGTLAGRRPRRRPAIRRAPGVPEGAWRLAAECAVIVGAAVVAWAVHLGRVGILLTLGGTWLVVAVFEAVASRSPQATWLPPPPASVSLPPVRAVIPPPVPAPAPAPPELPEPVAGEVGWPSRLEPVVAPEPAVEAPPELEPEPDLEPAPEAEAGPAVFFAEAEPDGGPSTGAFAVLEERAQLVHERDRRRRWWPRFGRQEKLKPQEAAPLEPGSLVEEPEPDSIEPDGGPSTGAFAVLEEEAAEPADQEATQQPRRRWTLFGRRETPAVVLESGSPVEEQEAEPIDYMEQQPEGEVDLVSPAPAPLEREYGRPSRFGSIELPRQPELEPEQELLVEPERPEPLEEAAGLSEAVVEPEAQLDDGPSTGAFAELEEASEQGDPDAARPRRWRLFGSRKTPAGLLDSEPLGEAPEPEPIDHLEQEADAEVAFDSPAPAPSDSEYGWPSRLGPIEPPRQPEPEAQHALVVESEPEPETEPEPLYAFSAIEPDGGPCVGAFTLLEEVAVLREQPAAEPPLPPRRGLLLLRRRRART